MLERIARGTWTPPELKPAPAAAESPEEERLHVTASRWWHRRDSEQLAPKTKKNYRWRLDHILVDLDLAHTPTSNIDVRRVDDFRLALVGRGLGPRTANMVLGLLAQILDDAVDYKLLDSNPARGKRRRMKVPKPSRSFLEPDMVVDLLDAAGQLMRFNDEPETWQAPRRGAIGHRIGQMPTAGEPETIRGGER